MVDMNTFKEGDYIIVVDPLDQKPWNSFKGWVGIATSGTTKHHVHLLFNNGETASFYPNQVEHAKNHIVSSILRDL